MRGNVIEALIGAVVLLVAGGFLTFAYSRSDVGDVSGYDIVVDFDRVDGISVGADVRMSGIKVGTVKDQYLDPETYYAMVRMSIDKRIQLPEDSSVKISSDGLLGSSYIAITAGGSDDLLEDGDRLFGGQGSVDLLSLLGQAVFQMSTDDSE